MAAPRLPCTHGDYHQRPALLLGLPGSSCPAPPCRLSPAALGAAGRAPGPAGTQGCRSHRPPVPPGHDPTGHGPPGPSVRGQRSRGPWKARSAPCGSPDLPAGGSTARPARLPPYGPSPGPRSSGSRGQGQRPRGRGSAPARSYLRPCAAGPARQRLPGAACGARPVPGEGGARRRFRAGHPGRSQLRLPTRPSLGVFNLP